MFISLAVIATAAVLSYPGSAARPPAASADRKRTGIGGARASMPPVLAPGRLTPVHVVAYAARMPDLRERWRTSFIEATTYDWAVEHEHVAGVLGRLIWGTNTSAFYRDIARLGELPSGTRVLDIPCGGGVAFRGLRAEQELHYVAADLSPVMLRRARAEADRRGIHWIEFVETDVEALPFDDRSFELGITYTGLHCFPDPSTAIMEIARVLRPGGELRGTSVIKQVGLRHDAFVRLMQIGGVFGPGRTLAELETSLADAGLVKVSTSRNGALAYFSARRRGGRRSR
jgi:SAM-dependent methyltransferase